MDNRSYKNRNRITPRAQWWDYSKNASYFVTICTHNRIHYFGEIQNGIMHLSQVGMLADQYWYEIINHSHNVQLGAFTVMPNHIHGILIFNDNIVGVGTRHALSLPPQQLSLPPQQLSLPPQQLSLQQQPGKNRFQNQGKNTLSSIVGSYESAVTKHAHRLNFEFEWQGRFYDNIIRDKESFYRIERYILNNVKNWKSDRFHQINTQKNTAH